MSATAFIDHILTCFEAFSISGDTCDTTGMQTHSKDTAESSTDSLPPWPGAHMLTSPLGVLSLHMLKTDCPRAIAHLWQVFVSTLALDFCENLTCVGNAWMTDAHQNILSNLGLRCSSRSSPQGLCLESIQRCIKDIIKTNGFMEWVMGEAEWEATELGLPPSDLDMLETIHEVSEGRRGGQLGDGSDGAMAHIIERMLSLITGSDNDKSVDADTGIMSVLPYHTVAAHTDSQAPPMDIAVHQPDLVLDPAGAKDSCREVSAVHSTERCPEVSSTLMC